MEGAALAVGRLEGSKDGAALAVGRVEGSEDGSPLAEGLMEGIFEMEGLIEDVAFDFDDLVLGCLDWIELGVFAVETTEDWKFSILFFLFLRALLHKDLKCKAPLIEPNLRRNLGKWST